MSNRLSFRCSVSGCYKLAHGSHSICWPHLVFNVIIFAGVLLALSAMAITVVMERFGD